MDSGFIIAAGACVACAPDTDGAMLVWHEREAAERYLEINRHRISHNSAPNLAVHEVVVARPGTVAEVTRS